MFASNVCPSALFSILASRSPGMPRQMAHEQSIMALLAELGGGIEVAGVGTACEQYNNFHFSVRSIITIDSHLHRWAGANAACAPDRVRKHIAHFVPNHLRLILRRPPHTNAVQLQRLRASGGLAGALTIYFTLDGYKYKSIWCAYGLAHSIHINIL